MPCSPRLQKLRFHLILMITEIIYIENDLRKLAEDLREG